ncbi:MAG: DNA-binding protein HU [Nitrospinae bacterium RIFCSPLOWO2_02_FULL_39_110]|nr:MAG: DNA-binding protein HU [Nitrospinae bacterium RIFCSPHIGHO2_12_FULL_39_42]OGW01613.1 MAG: DNA-binding protein HU [Nitrospinae bacterium RIFCSPHIGHO2_02_FULL_39_82]OGW02196.1 MAG: DNA-binding protein HU [Nitrospinae bacterium RIFCSPLOWO2_02_39_17]OGW06034.1 MAG: DNA-binding protein HU [Nitrospinae bacterium RIFCSPLOWO2_02_FULL_39_110]OGW11284.1 MAG: DNA-binding protein HU [Nitrospinae bacterium RIFCSPLOWO2_12_FULL_39_93]OGW11499.1 MAG: DNA-binding protein HU [Nitrospinae bacterium RIFCSP
MNKADIVAKIAKDASLSKAAAEKALNSFTDTVKSSLKKGQGITLVGFGTFGISKRAARTGRNPATGESIKISARKVPKFKPGQALKDAVR